MKAVLVLVFVFCYVECRKTYPPIDKNANLAFINMEGGGGMRPPNQQPQQPLPAAPPAKAPVPANVKPVVQPTPKPVLPAVPIPVVQPTPPLPAKPVLSTKPAQIPQQIKPVPVYPTPVINPITTPGPGSVKQLVNFYDSQGKASPIRPYSYSQAVKQG